MRYNEQLSINLHLIIKEKITLMTLLKLFLNSLSLCLSVDHIKNILSLKERLVESSFKFSFSFMRWTTVWCWIYEFLKYLADFLLASLLSENLKLLHFQSCYGKFEGVLLIFDDWVIFCPVKVRINSNRA